jgi:hypothetical protein
MDDHRKGRFLSKSEGPPGGPVVGGRRAIPDANQPLSLFQESAHVMRSAKKAIGRVSTQARWRV